MEQQDVLASFYSASTAPLVDEDQAINEEDYKPVRNQVGLVGIQNVGNTCYVASAFQLLAAVQEYVPSKERANRTLNCVRFAGGGDSTTTSSSTSKTRLAQGGAGLRSFVT